MKDTVLVEKNREGLAIRIFRTSHTAFVPGMIVDTMDYRQAVKEVRHQLFRRSNGDCELCGVNISETMGHMHEQKHRGKGGEISLANSVFICTTCHRDAHSDRNPRFRKARREDFDDCGTPDFAVDHIKYGETVCMHGARPFDCRMCAIREEKP